MVRNWPFVGRRNEVSRALAAITGPAARGGFVVSGQSGVGKSGLLHHVLADLDERHYSIIRVFATRATSSIHFGAFVALLPPQLIGASDPSAQLAYGLDQIGEQAAGRRVILAIDGLDLLDPLGAAFTYHAVRSGNARLAGTCRAGESLPDPISALWRENLTAMITLRPFDEATVRSLITDVLRGPVSTATSQRLFQLSQGNVLLLREIVESLVDDGLFQTASGIWQWTGNSTVLVTTTTEMIGRRVAQLPRPVRNAVELVALAEPVGRTIAADLIGVDAITAALDSGLIHAQRDQRRLELRVAHPLHADVVLQQMSDHDRFAHVTSLADAIRAHGCRRRDDVMRLALWHLEYGISVEADVLTAATRRAYAADDLNLATDLGRLAVAAGGGFDAVEVLATVLGFTGHAESAIALLDQTVASLAGEPDEIRWNMARAIIEFNMLHNVTAVEQLTSAVSRLSSPGRDILLVLAACLRFGRGEFSQGLADLVELATADSSSPPARLHAEAMAIAAAAACGEVGTAQRFIDLERRAADLYAEWPTLRVNVEFARQTVAFVTGDVAGMLPDTMTKELRFFPIVDTQTLVARAMSLRMRGRTADAVAAASAARSRADAGGQIFVGLATAEVAAAAAVLGRPAQAAEAMADCDQRYRQSMAATYPMIELIRLDIAATTGTSLPDLATMANALADRVQKDNLHGFEVHARHMLVRLDCADSETANRLAELAERIPERFPIAAALHAKALADGSPAVLDQVGQTYADLGLIVFALEAAAQRYDLIRRNGARGAGAAADQITRLLKHCDIKRVPGLRLRHEPLTRREREIADLVERGHDAAQISSVLVIGKRSVSTHLSNVYRKLGIHTLEDVPGIIRLIRHLSIMASGGEVETAL